MSGGVSAPQLLGSLDLVWCSFNGDSIHGAASQPFSSRILTSSLAWSCCSLKWRWDSGSGSCETKQAAKSVASCNKFLNLQGRERGKEGKKNPTWDIPCLIILHTSTAIETLWFPCLIFSCNIPFVPSRYVKSPWYSGSFKDLHFVFPCSFSDDVHKTEL